jgi:long-subunit fatty acid transport protein
MKKNVLQNLTKRLTFLFFISLSFSISAQVTTPIKAKSDFWKKVQYGGGFGLGFGSGFTNISVAPSAIYNVNNYFSAGVGLQYSYLKQKDFYKSSQYGASLIGLVNPIEEIQLSVELEQLRVNVDFEDTNISRDFWNTGLFVGAGYRTENVTIGARYNMLFDKDKGVYGDALMPFVRVFF